MRRDYIREIAVYATRSTQYFPHNYPVQNRANHDLPLIHVEVRLSMDERGRSQPKTVSERCFPT